MKVGTDGVLLGAWAGLPTSGKILDVGCGTGLISLMIAQRQPIVQINAIEIDEKAAVQTLENVALSPWSSRIKVFHDNYFSWAGTEQTYDLIISNPPFYNQGPNAATVSRDLARSEIYFPLERFMEKSSTLLNHGGEIALIVPYSKKEDTIEKAGQVKLLPKRICDVRPTPEKSIHRTMIQFSGRPHRLEYQEIIIEDGGRHKYSPAYIALTRDFYLKLL